MRGGKANNVTKGKDVYRELDNVLQNLKTSIKLILGFFCFGWGESACRT